MELPLWFKYMFNVNYWGFIHAFGGGALYIIFDRFIPRRLVFPALFLATVGWEVFEYFYEGTSAYHSTEKWFFDSLGDVVLALATAFLIWIDRKVNR